MNLAVLGCGNMGGAIIAGVQSHKPDWNIIGYDTYQPLVKKFTGVSFVEPATWFENDSPDLVLIAVKPQIMGDALSVFTQTSENTLWVSIAAGISIKTLERMLPEGAKVCRVMPNTPALIGEAMSAYTLSSTCDSEDEEKIQSLLYSIGKFIRVPEYQMDAVVGVSGSGPAYIYTVIEALAEGGVVAGLPYAQAMECAVQTVIGAAKMVQQTKEAPSVLRSQVMSPGGTTAAAVMALEEGGLRAAIMHAVTAAAKRSAELG